MRTLLLLLFTLAITVSKAQMGGPNEGLTSNLIVFSEDGKRFYLIMNGIRQNDVPETNVKVTGLPAPYYSVKIIFEDNTIVPIEKKMLWVQDDRGQPLEINYHIVNTKEGGRALRMFVQMPMTLAPPTQPGVREMIYTNTTRTTTGSVHQNTTGANINMNVDGMGFGMNVNINDPLLNGTESTTTTTTSTTTATTYSSGTSMNTNVNTNTSGGRPFLQGYNGPAGCDAWPMRESDFIAAKNSIASKSFDDTKLTTAKQIANSNCLTSDQVKQIMKLLSFESSRLDFAKYAYTHTFDVGNYFKVNDAFQFESSVDELNDFIGR